MTFTVAADARRSALASVSLNDETSVLTYVPGLNDIPDKFSSEYVLVMTLCIIIMQITSIGGKMIKLMSTEKKVTRILLY